MRRLSKQQIMFHVIEKFSMARGIVVLDENVESAAQALKDKNLRVIKVMSGMSDERIKQTVLSGRIFITNNTQDFIEDAKRLEYGIISTEGISDKDPEHLADLISRAIIDHSLWSKKRGFVVRLLKSGKSSFREIK